MTIRAVSPADLIRFRHYGLGRQCAVRKLRLDFETPFGAVKELVRHSARRTAWHECSVYLTGAHGIEAEQYRPLVKSPMDFARLSTQAGRVAFSCSRSEQELRDLGHTGALAWIERFKTPRNIEKLGSNSLLWYEMRVETRTIWLCSSTMVRGCSWGA